MPETRILVVDDEKEIADLIEIYLVSDGYKVLKANNAEEGLGILGKEEVHLVLLDIMLAGEDGISLLKKLRSHRQTADIPVIMATAKGTEYDKVLGLDLGADDYLAKPFGMMEMVSRVKAVLRRMAPRDGGKRLCVGQVEMDVAEHMVFVCGSRIELTLKEYELLHLFMAHPGMAFTRDQLLGQIWDTAYVGETRTVDVHIGTLRTKLGSSGELIKTVRGVGYRMEGKA